MSKWSRERAGKPPVESRIPALRRNEDEEPTDNDQAKTDILAGKFFPPESRADLSDIPDDTQLAETLPIPELVTKEEVINIIRQLPSGKSPGPDKIPNEVLKMLAEDIAEGLAHGISRSFASGEIPERLKESTTIALRKGGNRDYSLPGSYRPIALENTIAKIAEKAIANRLSKAAEERKLLL